METINCFVTDNNIGSWENTMGILVEFPWQRCLCERVLLSLTK